MTDPGRAGDRERLRHGGAPGPAPRPSMIGEAFREALSHAFQPTTLPFAEAILRLAGNRADPVTEESTP